MEVVLFTEHAAKSPKSVNKPFFYINTKKQQVKDMNNNMNNSLWNKPMIKSPLKASVTTTTTQSIDMAIRYEPSIPSTVTITTITDVQRETCAWYNWHLTKPESVTISLASDTITTRPVHSRVSREPLSPSPELSFPTTSHVLV